MRKSVKLDSSRTYKWGCFFLAQGQWSSCGFFSTEKAARKFAIDSGMPLCLIARRFEMAELEESIDI
jgi:hypothetical protein